MNHQVHSEVSVKASLGMRCDCTRWNGGLNMHGKCGLIKYTQRGNKRVGAERVKMTQVGKQSRSEQLNNYVRLYAINYKAANSQ